MAMTDEELAEAQQSLEEKVAQLAVLDAQRLQANVAMKAAKDVYNAKREANDPTQRAALTAIGGYTRTYLAKRDAADALRPQVTNLTETINAELARRAANAS